MQLLIVIVNYRTPDLAVGALASLAPQVAGCGARAVVVDNRSGDGSAGKIAGAIESGGWQGWASLMALDRNDGFADGNNAAIAPALRMPDPPEFVLMLNPDTIVGPGALDAMLAFMAARPRAGIVGARLENPDGSAQRSAFRFHSIASELEQAIRLGPVSRLLARWAAAPPVREEAHATDWVSGACLMVRRAVLDQVGLLDRDYFMYFEETDLCLRARRAGWECWYVPRARVVHLVGQASGGRRLPGFWYDSRRRYFVKNHGRLYAAAADLAWAAGHVLWRARRMIQRRPELDSPKMLSDFLRHSVFAAGFRTGRAGS